MNIGEVIKLMRKKRGFTQTRFAQMCDLSQTSLSLIEAGRTQPHPNTLKVIADKLQIPAALLYFISVGEEDIPEKKREAYKTLGPAIKALVLQLFDEEGEVSSLLSK